jgi:hypothetical protein
VESLRQLWHPLQLEHYGQPNHVIDWPRGRFSFALTPCLDIEDQTKERLDCYDEKVAPAPKQVSAPAKKVEDCRFVKEEDERLNCFNRFVNPPPKKNTAQQKKRKTP